jgi:hypothetical protein
MYADLTPLLPSKVSLWGLNLVSQFMDALSHDLQEALLTHPSYLPPDIPLLTSRSSQLDALRSLRVAAVRQFSLLHAQEKLIAKTVLRKMNTRTPGATSLAAPFSAAPPRHASLALPGALATMSLLVLLCRQPSKRCAVTNLLLLLLNPVLALLILSPISKVLFRLAFKVVCSAAAPIMSSAAALSMTLAPGASLLFFKNLFAHKPHLRTRNPKPEEMMSPPPASPGPPPNQSFVNTRTAPPLPNGVRPASPPATAGSAPLPNASILRLPPPPSTNPPPRSSPPKRARFFVQLIKSFPAHLPARAPVLPPMPIAIDNGLPHIEFDLGLSTTPMIRLFSASWILAAPSIPATFLSISG